ncbi:hypothetical protein UR09_02445 [Candidatus Nitromaritima sp. SCGC AAA799-A02]|nr:hypothetical protein UZ36_03300 [Candidatus Nitromaritima sp. SCGC AAA799-C22]KMP11845.1 hypothetical protein UR09_02445 [Candidatus Nitromaritima sp. SCGC AAA799-A02]
MRFDFASDVLEYLRGRNQSELTIDLEEIPSNCCLGRLPEVRLLNTSPENPDDFRHFTVEGINIHLSKNLRTENTLKLFLSGLGPFKKLEVAGINLIL